MKYWALALLLFCSVAGAVDNPDAPDYLGAFHQRMQVYQQRIDRARTTADMSLALVAKAKALDHELNTAYRMLMARLSPAQRTALRASQRQWLKCRDNEFSFINKTFTRQSHGTSSVLTVGHARNALVYARAQELWDYLEAR
ncbi:MAG: lysozyme inhibitor LprI family protein [Salinisphaera sp.]|uniref:lysozyme inhibitor LprI family protein n=1 Tax=Salinisphaera sp. TaxID=1914330 RepID=UPI003C7DA3B5